MTITDAPVRLSPDVEPGLPGLLITIGESYAAASVDTVDDVINDSLSRVGRFVAADRVYVFEYDWADNCTRNTHEWCAEGIAPEIHNLQHIPLGEFQIWVDNHRAGQPVYVEQVADLPPGHALRDILAPQGVQSLLALPLMANGQLAGFVGLDAVRTAKAYSTQDILLLYLFGQMLMNLKTQVGALAALMEAKAQAERAARAKDAFLNIISHELRTPMHAILGFTEILQHEVTAPPAADLIPPILDAGRRLSGLIDDILAYSELDTDGESVRFSAVHLPSLVADLQAQHAPAAAQRGLELWLPPQPPPIRLMLDQEKLRKVLGHLIVNGIKFTERGSVTLDIQIDEAHGVQTVTFSVVDTGIGIDSADQQRIFQPFSQADDRLTRKYPGAGLSVALCHRLVQAMGGILRLASTPGVGSRWWFTLPAERAKKGTE